jgi:hypothetical protein
MGWGTGSLIPWSITTSASGQARPARASLKGLPGTSEDPTIPDPVAATVRQGRYVPLTPVSSRSKIEGR